ncbi:uncharacterized protein LOC116351254 [Contarinia nasturtii]|uniref:uncharacterized protein LOC116340672 n=1 Tax=Contarinia nasturtii TaxID=265458 RepID=UPI0012D4308C|nr:uncharacterized protein LOC116340672 [Contarinia nasturtii]XP_031639194.1 uncharacterized protein LOC116351254 [Contarinia nasturtii]
MKIHSTSRKRLKCDFCSLTFTYRTNLRRHLNKKHSNEMISNSISSNSFPTKRSDDETSKDDDVPLARMHIKLRTDPDMSKAADSDTDPDMEVCSTDRGSEEKDLNCFHDNCEQNIEEMIVDHIDEIFEPVQADEAVELAPMRSLQDEEDDKFMSGEYDHLFLSELQLFVRVRF